MFPIKSEGDLQPGSSTSNWFRKSAGYVYNSPFDITSPEIQPLRHLCRTCLNAENQYTSALCGQYNHRPTERAGVY